VADAPAGEASLAEQPADATGKFDRDSAVWRQDGADGADAGDHADGAARRLLFAAEVAPDQVLA